MSRISQHHALLYRLMENRNKAGNEFLGPGAFNGQRIDIPELGESQFMSHEYSARLSEMYSENPELLEREWHYPASGKRYYTYRIKPHASRESIKDPSLQAFYDAIKKARERANWKPIAA